MAFQDPWSANMLRGSHSGDADLARRVGWRIAAGIFGGLIVICQGFDAMHHYGDHWVAWRAKCQQPLRERQFLAAGAGDYDGLEPNSPKALGQLASQQRPNRRPRTTEMVGRPVEAATAPKHSGCVVEQREALRNPQECVRELLEIVRGRQARV